MKADEKRLAVVQRYYVPVIHKADIHLLSGIVPFDLKIQNRAVLQLPQTNCHVCLVFKPLIITSWSAISYSYFIMQLENSAYFSICYFHNGIQIELHELYASVNSPKPFHRIILLHVSRYSN